MIPKKAVFLPLPYDLGMDGEAIFHGAGRSGEGRGNAKNPRCGAGKGFKSAGRGGAGAGIIHTIIINSTKDDIWDMVKLKNIHEQSSKPC